jgi:hypothetical protein
MKVKINSNDSAFNGWTGTVVESAGDNHDWVKLNLPKETPDWVKFNGVFAFPLVFRKNELELPYDKE